MASAGLQRGWYDDGEEPGLSRYWDGARWSGVRGTMRPGSTAAFSTPRWRRLWYGGVLRTPGVLSALTWSNHALPGLRGHLGRAIDPSEFRRP
jgi:hypothetical protein